MDYQEALQYISSVNWKGCVPGLERITQLLQKLGNPQDSLKFVHIGGTNGKGSTAAFISHILRQAGYKTGLFISPYIEVFNERMQINNQNISDQELAQITTYVRPYADEMEDAPTEFELNTAIAMVYFQRNHCDIAVLEVGMGGEFDATNVIRFPEAAIITAIGLDHMEYLGDTVQKIAATKAGIIKPGCDVVLYRQGEDVTEVIRERCRQQGAKLYLSEPDTLELLSSDIEGQVFQSPYGRLFISLAASYQKNNLAVALKAIEILKARGFQITQEDIRKGLAATKWPGRFEILSKDPLFIVDGAHNPHGMTAAVQSLKDVLQGRKVILIFGVLADKDYEKMLELLLPLAQKIFCVSPDSARALNARDLAETIRQLFRTAKEPKEIPEVRSFSGVGEAIDAAFAAASQQDVICALGSLYMIGDIKSYVAENYKGEEKTMKLIEKDCMTFIDELQSSSPVPGGGGTAALCGAAGTALGHMVGALTIGKKTYAAVEPRILEMMSRCEVLQKELLELVDLDAEYFRPLSDAYRLPADTQEEAKLKKERIEQCSKDACTVPLRIMETCSEAIDLAGEFAEKGSRLAVSDAGCSAALLEGAMKAASLNIFINTKSLEDRAFADALNEKAQKMLRSGEERSRRIFDEVALRLGAPQE